MVPRYYIISKLSAEHTLCDMGIEVFNGLCRYNWETLNQKVFKHHLHFSLTKDEILALCKAEVGSLRGLIFSARVLSFWACEQLLKIGKSSKCALMTEAQSQTTFATE